MNNELIPEDIYSKKTRDELITICKEKTIKGYSGKKRGDIIQLIKDKVAVVAVVTVVSQKQDTGKFRTNTKDQFYTNENVAKSCISSIINILPFTSNYVWVEPSAGNGSFLHNISFEKIGIDLEPMAKDIIKQDYLKWNPPPNKEIIVF